MSQFGTIKFRRTFKNYFGQFVWIEKKSHYNRRVSLHEAPTENRDDKNLNSFLTSLLRKLPHFLIIFALTI